MTSVPDLKIPTCLHEALKFVPPKSLAGLQKLADAQIVSWGDVWVRHGVPVMWACAPVEVRMTVEDAEARWGTKHGKIYRYVPTPSAAEAAGLKPDVPPVHHSTAGCGESAQAKVVASQIAENTKLSNPKDMVGSSKVPMHLFPSSATALGALALLDGALKYGRGNWRAVGVRSSIYYDAAQRHLMKWFEGEDTDPDSGLPHLAHALACIAILVDAKAAGKLNDDRAFPANFPAFLAELTPHVERLKAKHAARDPKHYTIGDSAK